MPPAPWLAGAAIAFALRSLVPATGDAVKAAADTGVDDFAVRGSAEIRVGAELMAIKEITLDEAVIARGSKVSVTRKAVQGGEIFLDVALADGHVVKAVPLVRIQQSFRLVA
jgi:hypothetical protein